MTMFREFFTFELKFRFKSLSTYVYFAVWFAFSFLDIASEGFGPIGSSNGKVLLNGPYANIYNDIGISFFGIIVIAAIFGTSILRDDDDAEKANTDVVIDVGIGTVEQH